MSSSHDQMRCRGDGNAQFTTTHWSVVLRAAHPASVTAEAALSRLCQTYWYPLYAFVRRRGHSPEDAQDLTQGFFAHVLANHALTTVDQARGKFRSFLLASLRHFLVNDWERARTEKRGGGQPAVSLDAAAAESRYGLEPVDHASPDKLFERNWALALMEDALARLRAEQAEAGKAAQFAAMHPCLMDDAGAPRHAELAAQLGMSADAVKMAVSRLRRRYRELLCDEIAQTVSSPAEVEEEIRHLFAALAS
jgi:RNA polymerase sigma factor (sigma-70 family)